MVEAEQRKVAPELIDLTRNTLEQQRLHAESALQRAMVIFSAASILLVVTPSLMKNLIENDQLAQVIFSPGFWLWPISLVPILLEPVSKVPKFGQLE